MGRALGEFEQLVMLAVVELEEDAYGAAIGRAIEARTAREVSAGAIYTALERLGQRGLVNDSVGDPTPERGGRRRRYYRLTAEGAAQLSQALAVIRSMSEGLLPKLEAMETERT